MKIFSKKFLKKAYLVSFFAMFVSFAQFCILAIGWVIKSYIKYGTLEEESITITVLDETFACIRVACLFATVVFALVMAFCDHKLMLKEYR